MTKLASTALVTIALASASATGAVAGSLTAPIVEPAPVVPVAGGLNPWVPAAIAAGLIGIAAIAIASGNDDDDDDDSSTTTTTTTTTP